MIRAMMLAGLLALPQGARAANDPATGLWLVESGKAIVELSPCGDTLCGKIVWLENPKGEDGQPRKDVNNVDESKRSRKLCGLDLVGNFTRDAPGEWSNGFIYNGEDGKTYTANIALQPDGRLKLRGYVGLPLLGKTQYWTRVADNRGGC